MSVRGLWSSRVASRLAWAGTLLVVACAPPRRGLRRVEPALGNVAGGEPVTIVGAGFEPGKTGAQVRFGRSSAKSVSVDGTSRIRVVSPPGPPGPVDVEVVFDDGGAYVLRNGFRYVEAGVRNPWEHFGEPAATPGGMPSGR